MTPGHCILGFCVPCHLFVYALQLVSGFSGMGIVEWWNSGMVEWWNGFFSHSFCLLVCVVTIVRST